MTKTTKRCPQCGLVKHPRDFYVNRGRYDGLSTYCHECMIAFNEEKRRAARAAAILLLGGQCARCGFADARALQIDHTEGGGHLVRRVISWFGVQKAVLAGEPGYQLLCANCNVIKRIEDEEFGDKSRYRRVVPG